MRKKNLKSWWKKYRLLIGIYLLFLLATGKWSYEKWLYRDVLEWPSVPAKLLAHGGGKFAPSTVSRFGRSSPSIDTRYFLYEYEVDGESFRGSRIGPNSDRTIAWSRNGVLLAYHHPSKPGFAVLSPSPYEGFGWGLTAFLSGIVVLSHWIFEVAPILLGRRKE